MCTILGNEDVDTLLITYLDLKSLREAMCMNRYVNKLIMSTFPSLSQTLLLVDSYKIIEQGGVIINFALLLLQENHYLLLWKLIDYFDNNNEIEQFLLIEIFENKSKLFRNYFECFDVNSDKELEILKMTNIKIIESRCKVYKSFLFPHTYNIIENNLILIIDLLSASANKINIINEIINMRDDYSKYFKLKCPFPNPNELDLGNHRRSELLKSLDDLILTLKC